MEEICEKLNLLNNNRNVIRIPFLIKGKIIAPPTISHEQIDAAFKEASEEDFYLKLSDAQLIREPIIDRGNMRYTGEFSYKVLPSICGSELIETDTDKLARGLYALSVQDVLDYLNSLSSTLGQNLALLERVRDLCHSTIEYPDAFLDAWFESLQTTFDTGAAKQMIDSELSLWGIPGSNFLDGWVEVPSKLMSGVISTLTRNIYGRDITAPPSPTKALIRAMPTRQLHITAGNAPEIPVISALRAVLTKSAAVIKCPVGATFTGTLFALASAVAQPEHPITQNLSVVYWQGGDASIENLLFMPGAFDRIVVWGSPETVSSVQSRALYSRIVCLNPRYGISMIGKEAFSGNLEDVVLAACADSMIYNQKSCTASLVHYVEGTEEQVKRYAELLQHELTRWDNAVPQFIPPPAKGNIKRMQRGKYNLADWYINRTDGDFSSGVVVMPDELDILDHQMCRLVVVRRVDNLTDTIKYLHVGVSTVGVYPEERRLLFRDLVLARGVSNILPLGQCERIFAGMPHDGMVILNQLVDWKNA
jgi:hypothetical protein